MTAFFVPHPVEAVVFDMDGTLLDTERLQHEAMAAAGAALGRTVDDVVFASMVGVHRERCRLMLLDRFGDAFPVDSFYADVDARFHEMAHAGVPLRPGVLALLDHLHARGLPLAVATSTSSPAAEAHLAAAGLLERFDVVVTRSHVVHPKPAPEPFLLAAKRLGVRPTHCLAVEDSPNGVRAAHAAGMATVLIPDLLPATDETRDLTVAVLDSLAQVIDGLVAADMN